MLWNRMDIPGWMIQVGGIPWKRMGDPRWDGCSRTRWILSIRGMIQEKMDAPGQGGDDLERDG